jgi:hypothetical protein
VARFKRVLATAAAVSIPALATVAFMASPAAANRTPNPECKADTKTTVTTLTNRPDHGAHGFWANNTLTRKVVFTRVKPEIQVKPEDEKSLAAADVKSLVKPEWLWHYHAEVTDTGTFKTFGGATLSPNAGHGLVANTTGTVTGGYSADFVAVACWQNFLAAYDDKYSPTGSGYSGDNPTSTSEFVKGDWGGKDFVSTSDNKPAALNNDWHWTYTTCVEKMTDSQANYKATKNEFAGDITGAVACPSPSASASTSTASPSASESSGGVQVIPAGGPTGGATSPGLPVTGSKAGKIAGWGLGLGAAGAILAWIFRKRRTRFVSEG